jgi:hypothetical protein
MDVEVPTVPLLGHTTDRLVQYVGAPALPCSSARASLNMPACVWTEWCSWSGTLLQQSHRAVAQQNRTLPAGVYASWWSNGSPAHMYGLRATVWLTEVNGHPVPDLDTYVPGPTLHACAARC